MTNILPVTMLISNANLNTLLHFTQKDGPAPSEEIIGMVLSRKANISATGKTDKRTVMTSQNVIEVSVEISTPVKSSKRKSTTPQRARKKPHAIPGSPSPFSFISETAVEELSDLRDYYRNQLRRINYISHEYLGQPDESGMLACIREPLKSLRLPRGMTIAQTARSLWTRVSGQRKLVHR